MALHRIGVFTFFALSVVIAFACSGGGGSNASGGSGGAGGEGGMANTSASSGTSGTTSSIASTSSATSSSATGGGGGSSCRAGDLLAALGKDHLLVGASMEDSIAQSAPFDLRYLYLAGGIADGNGPCQSCAMNCTSQGASCDNANGCGWWGCWQFDQAPPGDYVRGFIQKAQGDGQIPMITYYEILHASGVAEGAPEVNTAAKDQAFMARYWADFRFFLQQIDQHVALIHVEPDFWGYAQQAGSNPHALPAAVASANATDCAGLENSIAGMGQCFVAMARKYAPKAKIGLHASAWGTNMDVYLNKDPNFDVPGEAKKLGTFLMECGGTESDFIVVEASDRDAGYYQSIGQDRWWDETNATLPSFHQAFEWAKDIASTLGKPLVWWQLPVGNMSLPGGANQWKDNRVDYFFAHTDELAAAGSAAIAFGAGAGDQTNPSTDGGNLVAKVKAYSQAGGQPVCP